MGKEYYLVYHKYAISKEHNKVTAISINNIWIFWALANLTAGIYSQVGFMI